jgi:hypothetical protein
MEFKSSPFMETLYLLRTIEQIILYNKVMEISDTETQDAATFLEEEYQKETLNYPYTAPEFHAKAAIWASKIVYFSAQLLLYRENQVSDLTVFLPKYSGIMNASAILSADICLRFLPQIREELKRIDTEDPILPIIEQHLEQFHFSAVGFDSEKETTDTQLLFSDACLKQLYLDRIIERKAYRLAEKPEINACLLANFGDYKKEFWNELKTIDIETK